MKNGRSEQRLRKLARARPEQDRAGTLILAAESDDIHPTQAAPARSPRRVTHQGAEIYLWPAEATVPSCIFPASEVVMPRIFPPRVRTRTETPSDSTFPLPASYTGFGWVPFSSPKAPSEYRLVNIGAEIYLWPAEATEIQMYKLDNITLS